MGGNVGFSERRRDPGTSYYGIAHLDKGPVGDLTMAQQILRQRILGKRSYIRVLVCSLTINANIKSPACNLSNYSFLVLLIAKWLPTSFTHDGPPFPYRV
jgi:hypothetical protein